MIYGIIDFSGQKNNLPDNSDNKSKVYQFEGMSIVASLDNTTSVASSQDTIVISSGILYEDLNESNPQLSFSERVLNDYDKEKLSLNNYSGKFSIVIIDKTARKVILAIDKFSESKLCYSRRGALLYFSTSAKTIAKLRNDYSLSMEAVGMFFSHNYICAPLTIFEGIKKVSPGTVVSLIENSCEITKYYDVFSIINKRGKSEKMSFEESVNFVQEALSRSINKRLGMIDNCQPALLLSGGIDSTLLCDFLKKTGIDFKAFSASVVDAGRNNLDESDAAKIIAKHFQVPHEVIKVDPLELRDSIINDMASTDEPMSNKTYGVASRMIKYAASQRSNCIFSGDGGDELFLGYPWYQRVDKAQKLFGFLGAFRFIFDNKLASYFMPSKLNDLLYVAQKAPKGQLLTVNQVEETNRLLNSQDINLYYTADDIPVDRWFKVKNLIDLYYGTQAAIRKWNDISFNNGILHLSPMLDEEMINAVSEIPIQYLMSENNNKIILRKMVGYELPDISKLPKHGFDIPMANWIRTAFRNRLEEITDNNFVRNQGVFVETELERIKQSFLLGKNSFRLDSETFMCNYFVFQNWLESIKS